jgi:hypothetical protein
MCYRPGTMLQNGPARIAAFVAALCLVFAAAAAAGRAIDPQRETATAAGGDGMGHGAMSAGEPAAKAVRGLAVAEDGLRLVVERADLRRDAAERLRFRILDEHGDAVRDFDVEHDKRMHLILARRDLTGFQHLHPVMAADGTWATSVRLPDAGSYRVFADFTHDGRSTTLASDLRVDGSADLQDLPAPAARTTSDGYAVRLDSARVRAGGPAELRFSVTRGGKPVTVEPYLGADGHLVALREGDLAFLHVHPAGHADGIGFEATFPTTGRYRLFLQFRREGRVHTAAFTQAVA